MEQRQTTSFFRFVYLLAGIMQVGKRGLPTQYSFPLETHFMLLNKAQPWHSEVGLAEDRRSQIFLADPGNTL